MGANAGRVAPGCRCDAGAHRIVSIAIASIGETGFPLDSQGKAVYDCLAWFDIRTEPQAQQIAALIAPDRLFEHGPAHRRHLQLCKMLWLKQNEPEVYARTMLAQHGRLHRLSL